MKKLIPLFCFLASIAFNISLSQENQVAIQNDTHSVKKTDPGYIARFQSFINKTLFKNSLVSPIGLAAKKIVPITEYDWLRKSLKLFLTQAGAQTIPNIPSFYWQDVIRYQLSPQKKYLLVHTTSFSEKGSAGGIMAHITGEFLGRHFAVKKTKLFDIFSMKEIGSFENECIMHQWSPDETSLIIATAQKNIGEVLGITNPSKKGASSLPDKSRAMPTGEIFRYELFDIASQSILKTFENVQSLMYTDPNNLIIKYDNNSINTIKIKRDIPLSLLKRTLNIFIKQSTTDIIEQKKPYLKPAYTAEYQHQHQILSITAGDNKTLTFPSTLSYDVSPQNKYLLINQSPDALLPVLQSGVQAVSGSPELNIQTVLLNLSTNKKSNIANNMVTHEFSPDETLLLYLASPSTMLSTAEKPQYYVFIIKTGTHFSLEESTPIRSAYFTPENKLILIDESGTKNEISLNKKEIIQEKIPESSEPIIEYAAKSIAERGIAAIQSELPKTIESIKQTISETVTSAKKTSGEVFQKTRAFFAPSPQKIKEIPNIIPPAQQPKDENLTQQEVTKKMYAELPPELQALVTTENDPNPAIAPQNDEDEEFFDFPDNEETDWQALEFVKLSPK